MTRAGDGGVKHPPTFSNLNLERIRTEPARLNSNAKSLSTELTLTMLGRVVIAFRYYKTRFLRHAIIQDFEVVFHQKSIRHDQAAATQGMETGLENERLSMNDVWLMLGAKNRAHSPRRFITLAALKAAPTGNIDADEIREAVCTSLSHAPESRTAIFQLMKPSHVQSGVLDLLEKRLAIADNIRQILPGTAKKIVDWFRTLITSQTNVPVVEPAFQALHSTSSSLRPRVEAMMATEQSSYKGLLQTLIVAIPAFLGTTEVAEVVSTFTNNEVCSLPTYTGSDHSYHQAYTL
ncbi:hypothetical protein JOM56_013910 [Amanita muscaria]